MAHEVAVVPMCNQCQNVRATIFSEQTQELMCTECFTMLHAKGNRMRLGWQHQLSGRFQASLRGSISSWTRRTSWCCWNG